MPGMNLGTHSLHSGRFQPNLEGENRSEYITDYQMEFLFPKFRNKLSWPSLKNLLSCLARILLKKYGNVNHATLHISVEEEIQWGQRSGRINNLLKQNNSTMSPKHASYPPYSVKLIKIWVCLLNQAIMIKDMTNAGQT